MDTTERNPLLFSADVDIYKDHEDPAVKEAFLAGVIEGRRQNREYMLKLIGVKDELELS
jgi:hypothetical protein